MKLKIYNVFKDIQDLTDQQKVFLWFVTMVWRQVGWQETLTIDGFDFRRLMFGSKRGDLLNNVAFPKNLRPYFWTKFVGNERVVIALSDKVFEIVAKTPGPKNDIGVMDVDIERFNCQKMVIYLMACLNNMDQLIVPEEEGGMLGLTIDKKSRFRRQRDRTKDYNQHDIFSFEQFFE